MAMKKIGPIDGFPAIIIDPLTIIRMGIESIEKETVWNKVTEQHETARFSVFHLMIHTQETRDDRVEHDQHRYAFTSAELASKYVDAIWKEMQNKPPAETIPPSNLEP